MEIPVVEFITATKTTICNIKLTHTEAEQLHLNVTAALL